MSALWISQVTVSNADEYAKYAKRAGPVMREFGGEFIVRGGRYVQLEGEGHARHVVARFPTVEDAEACYNSAAYQEALDFAKDVSVRNLVIVEEAE
jgi:uncharacterized protein (DUF1330 family)